MNLRLLFIINEILEKFLPSPKRFTQIYFKQNELVLNEEKKKKHNIPSSLNALIKKFNLFFYIHDFILFS